MIFQGELVSVCGRASLRGGLLHDNLDTQSRLGVKKLVSPQDHNQCGSPQICSSDCLPNISDDKNLADCPVESNVKRQGPFAVRFDRGPLNSLER